GVRVLVVDDDVDTVDSTATLFEIYGVRVEKLYDGATAVERIKSGLHDLALIDLAMPGVSGLDVAAAIQHRSPSKVPFLLAVSGYANQEDKIQAAAAGFDLYLTKPFDVSVVLRLLTVLESRALAAERIAIRARAAALQADFIGLFTEMVGQFFEIVSNTQDPYRRERFLGKANRARALLIKHIAQANTNPSLTHFVLAHSLDKALALTETNLGNIQMLSAKGDLEIVTQRGFKPDYLRYFATVTQDDTSSCGRALRLRSTVAVDDVRTDDGYAAHVLVIEAAHCRSVCSSPLIVPDGRILGVLSTHFTQPRSFSPAELSAHGEHARQTALLVH